MQIIPLGKICFKIYIETISKNVNGYLIIFNIKKIQKTNININNSYINNWF